MATANRPPDRGREKKNSNVSSLPALKRRLKAENWESNRQANEMKPAYGNRLAAHQDWPVLVNNENELQTNPQNFISLGHHSWHSVADLQRLSAAIGKSLEVQDEIQNER